MDKIHSLEQRQEDARRRLQQAMEYDPSFQAEDIRAVLGAYQASDAAHRNALLHSVIEVLYYTKKKKTKPADFELEFLMKI